MTPRKHIDRLVELVKARVPDASIDVDAPARASGDWVVDIETGGQAFVVEFRPKLGFGLSTPAGDAFGEGPDEFLETAEAAVDRLAELVRTRRPTVPQRVQLLQELRENRGISQVVLASRLGVRQPTISKIERREDVALSTLRRYIAALGGELHITAQFADGKVEIDLDEDGAA